MTPGHSNGDVEKLGPEGPRASQLSNRPVHESNFNLKRTGHRSGAQKNFASPVQCPVNLLASPKPADDSGA